MSREEEQDAEDRPPVLRPETGRDGYRLVFVDRETGPSRGMVGDYPARMVAEPTGGVRASGGGG